MRHPSKPLLDKATACRAGAIGLGLHRYLDIYRLVLLVRSRRCRAPLFLVRIARGRGRLRVAQP
jgi:hypothetical protein